MTALSLLLGYPSDHDFPRWLDTAMAVRSATQEQMDRGWRGSPASLSAALVVVIAGESRLDEAVHRGKRGMGGAVCPAQIDPGSKGLVRKMGMRFPDDLIGVGREATERCLRVAARLLAYGNSKCYNAPNHFKQNWAQAMFTHYATGNKCWLSKKAWKRGKQLHWLLREVHDEN
jgi:hypothetical protein